MCLLAGLMMAGPILAATPAATPTAAAAPKAPTPSAASKAVDWKAPVQSPNYGKATASDPLYQDKSLWPNIVGGEYYVKQTWPPAKHVYVWAHPGEAGWSSTKPKDHNPMDTASWLENGRPVSGKIELGPDTDVILPDSAQPYAVQMAPFRTEQVYRHITCGRNATLIGGGDGVGRKIYGNVWIKQGGGTGNQGSTTFLGDKHTFFRNDNAEDLNNGKGLMVTQYFTFNRSTGGSVEFLGHVTMLDEFRISASLCIVGPDSKLQPGRNASPIIEKGGTLAIMDGGLFASWINNFSGRDLEVTGVVQGGFQDRLLTRNATLGLHWKNFTGSAYDGPGAFKNRSGQATVYPKTPSLIVHPASAIKTYSTDFAKAHLVINWLGTMDCCNLRPKPGSPAEKGELAKTPDAAGRWKWIDSLPHKIDCWFDKGVTIDGVEFDDVHKGGVLFADPATRAAWKNILFGPKCDGKGPEMFSQATLDKGGHY